MVLEFLFEYSSSSLVYDKVLLKALEGSELEGRLVKSDTEIKLYVEAEDSDLLEKFANELSLVLPHSIFLRNTEVNVVDAMPDNDFILPQVDKPALSFCPSCLSEVLDESSENYYNPHCECDVCGYGSKGKRGNYKSLFEQIANTINSGMSVKVNTFYGEYYLGKLDAKCNEISFDVLSYDLATISKYTNVTKNETIALGAIEKPLIGLKTNLKFKTDFEGVEEELLRFKLADDFVLYLTMVELHKLGVDCVFITKGEMKHESELLIADFKETMEPIECVVSERNIVILRGDKGLPNFELTNEAVIPYIGTFNSVIKEHDFKEKTVVGLNMSKDYHNNILVYGKKFGLIEYLSFKSEYSSVAEIFKAIADTNETGIKLLKNYKNEYTDLYEKVSLITFDEKELNVYKLWGIISIILGYSNNKDIYSSAEKLENNAKSFSGSKGPRIDYKLQNIDSKVYLDPLMVIRTAMTFKLAGVDSLCLSYGVVESFVEFLSGQLDEIKQNMNNDVVVATGSLLGNKHLFSKLDKEVSVNHELYFNKELPVDGINIRYGGNELLYS
ncbi:hydrogenase [Sulfurimonas sp.]|uniref:hydrogenase n=1 Tax=Sulfurimonas sp. TaxID=2022749 RepID=UPI00356AE405